MYLDNGTITRALHQLNGTADHMLKIWLTLKHMGLAVDTPAVEIDTGNSTPSLRRLFSYGASDNSLFVPFAHTARFAKMEADAARSIIQTNVRRWESSQSVVRNDPTSFLDFSATEDSKLLVSCGRRYPLGLGHGTNGFALQENTIVNVPLLSFAAWYCRTTPIPADLNQQDAADFLINMVLTDLNISPVEKELIFAVDQLALSLSDEVISDEDLFNICAPFLEGTSRPSPVMDVPNEDFSRYSRRVRSMVSQLDRPEWLRSNPERELRGLLESGAKAILLYGPPRTGKTRLIDSIIPRDDSERSTIQIHDGWTYDNLMEGFQPDAAGIWRWHEGPLKEAITSQKKYVILEEINRTSISQALGEVFSLIEDSYRGVLNAITLRSGEKFSIPTDTIFILTMNTVDKSTEDVDDALMGRVAAVEFPPLASSLLGMMEANRVPHELREQLSQLYSEILPTYPLGHGYFAGIGENADAHTVIRYYKTRIRPVLLNFLGVLRRQDLDKIDNLVDELFGGHSVAQSD